MRSITHPNVLELFEVYEDKSYIHLLLPLLTGQELFMRMKQKCIFSESDALPIMRSILSALAYLHGQNIVHRDLKPQNLILASKKTKEDIRIVDFGLAERLSDPSQKLLRKCGTPGYTSPELLRGEGYSFATDIFSTGVIFAEMITGRVLFKGRRPSEVFSKIANYELDFPEAKWKNVSADGRDLVQAMLAEDPDERITAEQALKHRWFRSSFAEEEEKSRH